jgi:hypothetical protein
MELFRGFSLYSKYRPITISKTHITLLMMFSPLYLYSLSYHDDDDDDDAHSGIMSGQSEKDFTLGYAINLYSHLNLIAATTEHAQQQGGESVKPVYVNVSSLAVYGGEKATPSSKVVSE